MTVLVTGSAGHLGEGLMRTLRAQGRAARGLDLRASEWTDLVGSIDQPEVVDRAMQGVEAVLHAATLHKPHLATHSSADFISTNISGTLTLLEAAHRHGAAAFVFTSTTSAFGDALSPSAGAPAVWIDEDVRPQPKNIYGVSKTAAEDLCRLYSRNHRLPCVVLRTARFFPEPDDDPLRRAGFDDANLKANEFLHRRADIADLVDAHLLALERAGALGFANFVLSATTPFAREDVAELARDAASVIERRMPGATDCFSLRGWRLPSSIDRVYDNARARHVLGWRPRHDFGHILACLRSGRDSRSELARTIGIRGYHGHDYRDGLYPTTRVPAAES